MTVTQQIVAVLATTGLMLAVGYVIYRVEIQRAYDQRSDAEKQAALRRMRARLDEVLEPLEPKPTTSVVPAVAAVLVVAAAAMMWRRRRP